MSLELSVLTATFDEKGYLHSTEPFAGKEGEEVQIVVVRISSENAVTETKNDELPTPQTD